MNIFTTKSVNIISLIISIVIFLFINLGLVFFQKVDSSLIKFNQKLIEENTISYETDNNYNDQKDYNWYIEIKSIALRAPIEESIDARVLSQAVGHFEDTALKKGNIGLAAHNRGYDVNYFENLKSVSIGDEIIYKYNDFSMIYVIDTIEIIEDTDWSYLDKSEENKITLITCVENEPHYRRCVQATQKE
ncbi:MAG: class D sortase [Clostridia bacterium]|nr:class D sortase [Clostridia bacterium]